MDGEELNRVGTSQRSDNRSYNINENFHWSKSFNQGKHGFNFSVNGTLSRNKDEGWQIDSIASNSERDLFKQYGKQLQPIRQRQHRVLHPHQGEEQHLGQLQHRLRKQQHGTDRHRSVHRTDRLLADQQLHPELHDPVSQHRLRDDSPRNSSCRPRCNTTRRCSTRMNSFPKSTTTGPYSEVFRPSVSFNYTINPENRISANYSTSAQQPGVEQLRNELEYSNPLYLSGGNPNLQQSYTHSFGVSYNHTKNRKCLVVRIQPECQLYAECHHDPSNSLHRRDRPAPSTRDTLPRKVQP